MFSLSWERLMQAGAGVNMNKLLLYASGKRYDDNLKLISIFSILWQACLVQALRNQPPTDGWFCVYEYSFRLRITLKSVIEQSHSARVAQHTKLKTLSFYMCNTCTSTNQKCSVRMCKCAIATICRLTQALLDPIHGE